jgi:hypothetical protein
LLAGAVGQHPNRAVADVLKQIESVLGGMERTGRDWKAGIRKKSAKRFEWRFREPSRRCLFIGRRLGRRGRDVGFEAGNQRPWVAAFKEETVEPSGAETGEHRLDPC